MAAARRSSTYRHSASPAAGWYAVPITLAAVGVAWWVLASSAGFTTDSESYLDVARSLREGHGLVQRVVDFWRPSFPDPLGMWPPMYPLVIAGLSRLGIPLDAAARAVSAVSFVVFAVAFFFLAARAVGARRAFVVSLLALVIPGVALASGMAWSEMMFMALMALALMGLASIEVRPLGHRRGLHLSRVAVWAGLAAGLAALTRYSGLVLIPVGLAWFVFRNASPRVMFAWAVPAVGLPVAWLIRNIVVFGNPLGPGLPSSRIGFFTVIGDLIGGLRWAMVPWPAQEVGTFAAVILATLFVLMILAFTRRGVPAMLVVTVIAYLVLLLVARSRWTFNVVGERYLTPTLPLILLAATATLSGLAGRVRYIDRIALALALLMGVTSVITLTRRFGSPEYVAERAERHDAFEELRGLVPGSSEPVLSDVGHLVRSATGRPAVEVPSLGFSMRPLSAVDVEHWRALGVHEGIFRRPYDPTGDVTPVEERLGPWLASRIIPGGPDSWTILAATDQFIRVRLP